MGIGQCFWLGHSTWIGAYTRNNQERTGKTVSSRGEALASRGEALQDKEKVQPEKERMETEISMFRERIQKHSSMHSRKLQICIGLKKASELDYLTNS